jgi:hypothetical protein
VKVNIYETVEVSDEARKRLKKAFNQKQTVTRDQLKEFIWEHGRNWESFIDGPVVGPDLSDDPVHDVEDLLGSAEVGGDDEDLIGGGTAEDLIGGDDLEGLL